MEANTNIFSSRKVVRLTWPEIILIVLLIMVLEGVVFYLSAMHSGSVSAMNYVSFAGTITSIILALVAIIYTMVESLRQSSSTDKMVSAAISVQNSAQKIEQEVQSLKDLRESITATGKKVEELGYKIDSNSVIGEIPIESPQANNSEGVLSPSDIKKLLPNIVSSHFYLSPIYTALMMSFIHRNVRPNDAYLDITFTNVMNKVLHSGHIDYEAFKLAFFVFFRTLVGISILSRNDDGTYCYSDASYEAEFKKIITNFCRNTSEILNNTEIDRDKIIAIIARDFSV